MRRLFYLSILLTVFALTGCEPTGQQFISRSEMAFHHSDLKAVQLMKGDTVWFDNELGWYDVERGQVDGRTVSGRSVLYSINDITGAVIQPPGKLDPVGLTIFLYPVVVGILYIMKLGGFRQ